MLLWRDRTLWFAVVIAPVFWFGLSFFLPVSDVSLASEAPLFYLQMVLLYPVLEEIVFRGGVQPYLHDRLKGKGIGGVSFANILTSVLFSLVHLVFRSAMTAVLVYLPSLVFGYFRDKYPCLTIPIVLHCYYNAGFYLLFIG